MTMRVQSVVPWIAVVGTIASWCPSAGVGQELALAPRTPRFFYASSTDGKPVEIDALHSVVLGRVVSLHVVGTTIRGLLGEIQRQTGLTFAYDPHFPSTRPITLQAESITVAAALGAILVGKGVDVVLTRTGHVWLTESKPSASRVQEGSIIGKVTDEETGGPLVGSSVTLEPTRQRATTGSDGNYRFPNVSPGDYVVRARYIGYRALAAAVTVNADQEKTVDFPLVKSAQQLDEVVTTGSVVPTEVKALPTPVSVIDESDIAAQRPHTVQGLIRQAIPTAVGWDQPAIPYSSSLSVRGASTLSGSPQMKVFVDGIESASPDRTQVDPSSIARIEVVRGPQAATMYGSDAIGGVVQIFTKRGGESRVQADAEATLGLVQTPYAGYDGVLRQKYAGSVRGSGPFLGFALGASYSRTGDYLPHGEISSQSNPSIYGGVHLGRGTITADVSARYFVQNAPNVFNPELFQTGFSFFTQPNYLPNEVTSQGVGARVVIAPTSWWRNAVTVGIDRIGIYNAQTQPRLTSQEDTLLTLFSSSQTKRSIAFNSSVQRALTDNVVASLTAGVDHYAVPLEIFYTSGALNTTGTIHTAPGQSITAGHIVTSNTGYFAQTQIAFRDALFLTAGLRAESNSEFGDSLGVPVSPRIGISYAQQLGEASLKIRGSWGRAIRAPSAGAKFAQLSPTQVTLANPQLGPERQQGWDAGADLVFNSRASLSVTYYDQTAKDLIAYVQTQATPVLTYQYQNVGRVRNTGLEVEGAVRLLKAMRFKGQYGYTRARVEQLAPSYTGDLQPGDQTLATPKHTAGASLTAFPYAGATLSAGLTYVGAWNQYNYRAEFSCFGGAGPCQPATRDYIVAYPSFLKLNAAVSHLLTPYMSAVVSVDNLTNSRAYEGDDLFPVMGRITTAGLQLRY